MRLNLTFLFIFISFFSFSQGQANNWFFGENVGLKFNGQAFPTTQNGALKTIEGCASISDKEGNLLFYSDGITVYTRNHEVMQNGKDLKGHSSSTQSAIIVPNPVDENIYYLFTVGQFREAGFHFYTVDISLNNGDGAVLDEGVDLDPSDGTYSKRWTEKITAVKSDECDYWVISMSVNKFFAYKIDENGVNVTPVMSTTGFFAYNSRGYLKVSPDGTKIAVAHQGITEDERRLFLYDFNKVTGEITNENILFESKNDEQPYGVEFSAESAMLYATTTDFIGNNSEDDEDAPINGNYRLYQFDLKARNIKRSKTLIHTERAFRGALQLGPDKKIYATIPESYYNGTKFLDVILEPELKGRACRFRKGYINLGNNFAMQGLPPFIQSIFIEEEINIVNPFEEVNLSSRELSLCENSSYILEGQIIPEGDYYWTFDNGSGEVPLSLPTPRHKLTINSNSANNSGLYKLVIDTNDKCDLQLIGEANLTFSDPPVTKPLTSIIKCDQFDENPDDGLTFFNLDDSLDDLTYDDTYNFTAFYYLNDVDAIDDLYNQNSLPIIFANTIPNQTVSVKLFHINSLCYNLSKIDLVVNTNLVLNTAGMIECELQDDQAIFDLKTKKNEILSSLGVTGDLEISFFNTIGDALNNINDLGDSKLTGGQEVIFNVDKDGLCYGSGKFDLIVSTFPPLEPVEYYTPCSFAYPILINASIPVAIQQNYEYLWRTGETSHEISINSEQTVELIIKAKLNDCEYLKTYKITDAPIPTIVDYLVSTQNDINSITVLTENDHENLYAIGGPFSEFQDSNVFSNIEPGVHDVFVRNKYNCKITTKKIYVLGFPKFFTPNNDGSNDYWQIRGLDVDLFTFSDIRIFDRFGKFLKAIHPSDYWTGIYNGQKLPSTDYWFSIDITDLDNVTKNYKGHFSMIRK